MITSRIIEGKKHILSHHCGDQCVCVLVGPILNFLNSSLTSVCFFRFLLLFCLKNVQILLILNG